jgi:hypothetical protein
MLTGMSKEQWTLVVDIFRMVRSKRGDKGRDDRRFLEASSHAARASPWHFG